MSNSVNLVAITVNENYLLNEIDLPFIKVVETEYQPKILCCK